MKIWIRQLAIVAYLLLCVQVSNSQPSYYHSALEWIMADSLIRHMCITHLWMDSAQTRMPLHFAVSDTLEPIADLTLQYSPTCEPYRIRDSVRSLYNQEYNLSKGRFEYCASLNGMWNETDSLVLTFGYVFNHTLRAYLSRRSGTVAEVADRSAISSYVSNVWHPRGRKTDVESTFLQISLCFGSGLEVCNEAVVVCFH